MKFKIFLFTFCLFAVQNLFALSDTNTLCQKMTGNKVEAEVCFAIPNDWDKNDIVYFMHGSGGSSLSWNKNSYYQAAMAVLSKNNLPRPLVVTISFGKWWILKDFGNQAYPSLLLAFLEIQTQLETEIFKNKKPVRRMLLGESMGGFNSLLLLTKSELPFERAALLCPGFADIGPFSTPEEVQKYLARNKPFVDDKLIYNVLGLLKMEFPTPELWQSHAPFSVVGLLKNRTTQFYVTGNTEDEYGFGEGAFLLQSEMAKMNLPFAYEVIPGRHCVMNVESLAKFLK